MRPDGRNTDELRPLSIETNIIKYAEGSALIKSGDTHIICTASIDDGVPPFLKGTGTGWVTSEYSMLPRSTHTRNNRDSVKGRVNARSQEIQRLIGRSLRSIIDLNKLGERSIILDCDVVQADGGTRTASITGSYVALSIAVNDLLKKGFIEENPLNDQVAAISVGIVNGVPMLDLCYDEDSNADVDMNIVKTGNGNLVEIQGTAEGKPFSIDDMNTLVEMASVGINKLFQIQQSVFNFD